MIGNSDIQAAWIAKSKASIPITSQVSAAEIREDRWKGTNFAYPNVRIKLGDLVPNSSSPNCQVFKSPVSFLIFTEEKSSKQADDIAEVICNEFWGKSFTVNGVRFIAVTLDSVSPADVPEGDQNAWVSSVNFTALVSSG